MRQRTTTILVLALTAGIAAGCGGDDEEGEPIPAEQAAALERQLESIRNRFEFGGGACANITGGNDPNTNVVRSTIASLPQNVDPDVRQTLEQGFERLFELAQEQCDEQKGQEEQPPADTGPTVPPEDDEDDDEEEDEEQPPPAETGPTAPTGPTGVTPETTPPEGTTGATGEGGGGGSGTAGQGGGGGALVPEVAP
jgi:hypothetical protein